MVLLALEEGPSAILVSVDFSFTPQASPEAMLDPGNMLV